MGSDLIVNDIIKFSNVDGPGNRYTIFTQGCNVSCIYCHNFETIALCNNCGVCVPACNHDALSLFNGVVEYVSDNCEHCNACIYECPRNSTPKTKILSVDSLVEEIKKYTPFIQGVTVSGGECTLQHQSVTRLFSLVHKIPGLSCFIDTNGYFDFDNILGLIEETDKFMIDIKGVGNTSKIIGACESTRNLENLQSLLNLSKVYEVRTVIMRDFTYFDKVVRTVAEILSEYNVRYKLIKMRNHFNGRDNNRLDSLIPTEDEMMRHLETVQSFGIKHVEVA